VNFEVIDNAIPLDQQNIIEDTLFGTPRTFNWYYTPDVTHTKGVQKRPAFIHDFVLPEGRQNSKHLGLLTPIMKHSGVDQSLNIIKARSILQLPLNTKFRGRSIDMPHVDLHFKHTVYLYYVLDADGDTIFYNNDNKISHKIKPKKGRLVIFDGSILHTAKQPTKGVRCIINIDLRSGL